MMKVYVCSPYRAGDSAELDRNIEYAQALTRRALKAGLAPITPHLYITQCLDEKKPQERAQGLAAGMELLKGCDFMIVGDKYGISEGMYREIETAKALRIPVINDAGLLVRANMTFSDREIACGNAITFSANRLQYASNATKLQVSTQLFDRALLNRNGVMDIWNMAHVEDGEKYYIRKEYTEVSELNNSNKEPKIIIQQVPQAGQQGTDDGKGKEPTEGEPKEPPDDGKQKEGVNNAD